MSPHTVPGSAMDRMQSHPCRRQSQGAPQGFPTLCTNILPTCARTLPKSAVLQPVATQTTLAARVTLPGPSRLDPIRHTHSSTPNLSVEHGCGGEQRPLGKAGTKTGAIQNRLISKNSKYRRRRPPKYGRERY